MLSWSGESASSQRKKNTLEKTSAALAGGVDGSMPVRGSPHGGCVRAMPSAEGQARPLRRKA